MFGVGGNSLADSSCNGLAAVAAEVCRREGVPGQMYRTLIPLQLTSSAPLLLLTWEPPLHSCHPCLDMLLGCHMPKPPFSQPCCPVDRSSVRFWLSGPRKPSMHCLSGEGIFRVFWGLRRTACLEWCFLKR